MQGHVPALFLTGCYFQPIRVVYPGRPGGVIMGARRVVPCGEASGSGLGACVGLFVSLGSADCYCKASIDGIFSGKILFIV